MTTIAKLPENEIKTLLEVVEQSFAVRRHWDLFTWLQNEVQHFLRHDILIAAWGDFSLGLISYDIVSPLPGVRTENCKDGDITPLLLSLFRRWLESGHEPFVVRTGSGFAVDGVCCPQIVAALARMRCGLVHGIKDQRGRDDCIYALLGPAPWATGVRNWRCATCFRTSTPPCARLRNFPTAPQAKRTKRWRMTPNCCTTIPSG